MREPRPEDVPKPGPWLRAADGEVLLPSQDGKESASALLTADGRVLRVDANYADVLGVNALPDLGTSWPDTLPAMLIETGRQMFDELTGAERVDRIVPLLASDLRWARLRLRRVQDLEGTALVLVQVDDLTSPDRASLVAQVIRDPLTGVFNRRALEELLALPGRWTERYTGVLAVDVRRFRRVNDVWGRAVGDACLAEVARWLDSLTADNDVLIRLADAEFLVLLSQSSPVPQALTDRPSRTVTVGEHAVQLSLQAGLASSGPLPELAARAEMALSEAKRSGWRTVVAWSGSLAEAADRAARTEEAVQQAVASRAETVHFQPLLDVVAGRVIGVEALVRLGGAAAGVPASQILQASHRLGLTPALARRVYRQALRDGLRLREVFPDCQLAVNVSREFLSTGLAVDTLLAAVAESGVPSREVTLEITEDVATGLSAQLLQTELAKAAAAGLAIAVDDFGRGETSLALLRMLPLAAIKLDRSLLPTSGDDQPGWDFVAGAVALLSRITPVLVAEGVETAEQSSRLVELGVARQQGFLFGMPAPAEHWLTHPVAFPPPEPE